MLIGAEWEIRCGLDEVIPQGNYSIIAEGDDYYLIRAAGRQYNQYVRKSDIDSGNVHTKSYFHQDWGRIGHYYGGLPGTCRR